MVPYKGHRLASCIASGTTVKQGHCQGKFGCGGIASQSMSNGWAEVVHVQSELFWQVFAKKTTFLHHSLNVKG